MATTLGWIRQFHKPVSPGQPALLIFPHAGSGASAYRWFSKAVSPQFSTVIFQYPGRQDRVREPAAATLPDLAAGAFEEFRNSRYSTQTPLTVFGHSMGAVAAFEFVRLAEQAGIPVRLLMVSAAVAPDQVAEMPSHPTDDDLILGHLGQLNGTGGDILASQDVMRLTLPVIKADYRAFDGYSCPPGTTVAADIHAVGGEDDPYVTARHLQGWARHTTGTSQVTLFDGGHFFLNDNAEALAGLLAPAGAEMTGGHGVAFR